MTRAHIEVVLTMSLNEAVALRNHLNATTEANDTPTVIDVYNMLGTALEQAEAALA